MARPTDWSPVGMDSDPTPGDPDEIRSLADELQTFADDVGEALGRVRGMAEDRAVLDWAGLSADAFRSEFDGVPGNLEKLETSYALCAQALQTYWPKLETAQGMADRALDRAIAAQADLSSAQSALSDAQDWVSRAGEEAERLEREGERDDVEPPSEADVRAATRDANAANEAASAAQTRVDDAEQRLSAARELAEQAREMREEAASQAARDIDEASDAGIQNRSWWEDAVHWVRENWDTIVEVCKVVVAVLGIVVMIIGGPLAWVLLAAALVVLADTLYDYANGRASLWDVAFAALDCIPGMKGLTTAAGLATGLRRYAANFRNLGPMFRQQGIRGIGRVLIGDPIDVITGEMTLRETDVELPGVLSLTLAREHLSTYRAGRWFGPSWASTLDQRLVLDDYGVDYYADDGMCLHYPVPRKDPDQPVMPVEAPRWGLSWDGRHAGELTVRQRDTGLTLHFAPVPGRPGTELPITAISDRNDNRITFVYDEHGAPTEVTHSGGYRIGVAVHDGRVTALTLLNDPDRPLLRAFEYDPAGNLAGVYNSSGLPLRYEYDAERRMTRWEDRNGTWYRYEYDEAGRCVFTTGTDGVLAYRYDYEPERRRTIATNSLGHATTYEYNDFFQLVAETDPLGNVTRKEWTEYHDLLSVTDPLGRTTRYDYDPHGNLVTVTRPDGSTQHTEYNDLGLPSTVVQPDGGTWSRAYDARGNVVAILDPAGGRTHVTYDPHGGIASVTNTLGHTAHIRCDAAGLPLEVTDPLGGSTSVVRDSFGRPSRLTDPNGAETTFTWTVEGRLLRRTDPTGAVDTFTWDGEGNLLTHNDAKGAETSHTYGPFDLLTSYTTPDGATHRLTRDTELNLVQVTNALGATWTYTFDAAGRLASETDFDGRETTYRRDAVGQLTELTNSLGETVSCAYDSLGRRTAMTTSDGDTCTYTYDPLGRVVSAASPGVELSRVHDALGNLVSETVNGRVLTLTHDTEGQLLSRRNPSGHASTWTHAPNGRPATLTTDGRTITFDHDPTGREIARHIGEHLTLTHQWNGAGALEHHALTAPTGRVLSGRSYTYRQDHYPTALTDHRAGTTSTFTLDPVGRPTAVAHSSGRHESYAYDIAGNQTSARWSTADTPTEGERDYAGTLLTRAGAARYSYDAAGRPTRRQVTRLSRKPDTWCYAWNARNQLTETVTPDGSVWRYLYDPFGRRVAKRQIRPEDGTVLTEVWFTWHDGELIEQTTSDATITWNHREAQLLTQTHHTAGQEEIDRRFFAIVTDLVGSPIELVDERGTTAWTADTTLWGLRTAPDDGAVPAPLGFPGQYIDDETGWHYNYFRHYDPNTGRYVTQDPLGLLPAPNPWTYPHNPLLWCDPFGLAAHVPREFVVDSAGVAESLPVHVIDSSRWRPQADNFLRATENGAPALVTYAQRTESQSRRVRRQAQAGRPRPRRFASDGTWEEYPFASTFEGGAGATLTLSPQSVNSSHGNALGQFYEDAGLSRGDQFLVRVR
ncbi:DUF6531 domain-containing protein [Streptomyces sp. NPDC127098]|uniref:DUF6531 domain-containing protein n=1 Tax=Streptomyces sp. NPDC127098 TaxID=3347137 RepID=UPI0036675EEB